MKSAVIVAALLLHMDVVWSRYSMEKEYKSPCNMKSMVFGITKNELKSILDGRGEKRAGIDRPETRHKTPWKFTDTDEESVQDERFRDHMKALKELNATNIRENLKFLAQMPSTAGSPEAKLQADYTRDLWKSYGFDKVTVHKYNVLLSFPVKPGRITLYNEDGDKIVRYIINDHPTYARDEKEPQRLIPFNAFSPPGDVEGQLVYANYGRDEDFVTLENMGIPVKGKIVLMRYGKTSRAAKVERAQNRGAVGCLLFSDPDDWSPSEKTYPEGWDIPETGLQIGTVLRRQGDVLSREYPAKDGYWRKPLEKADFLPKIPSQPVPQKYVIKLLKEMRDGVPGPDQFQGSLEGVEHYKLNTTKRVRLQVETKLESRPTYSVTGTIYGDVEPDRLVLLGNHRDSWNFGTADATSGTAVLLEISRALGKLRKSGWKPRRSIMLCSWDAEQYGTIASTEFVEEFSKILGARAVAYLNVDVAVEGNYTIRFKSTPQMDEAFFDSTKQLPAPDDQDLSLYEDWAKKLPSRTRPGEPEVKAVKSGSDYKPFIQTAGVPSLDIRYLYDKAKTKTDQYSVFPRIRNGYEWMKKYVDRDFRYHLTVGRMWTKMGLTLSDSTFIPFNLTRYAERLVYYAQKFDEDHMAILKPHNISLDPLISITKDLVKAAVEFHKRQEVADMNNPIEVRIFNDQLMLFERSFIHDTGINGRPDLRHVIFATTSWYLKGGNKFPGLKESIYRAHYKINPDWDEVKKELTILCFHIQQAIDSLDRERL